MDENEGRFISISRRRSSLSRQGCSSGDALKYILNINNAVMAFTSLGEGIVLAVVVSYVGVLFAKQVKRVTQYRTVETIDF